MSMACLRVRDLLPEFALDVLDEGEVREIEQHIESCPGCRREADEFRESAARIALSLPPEVPGPALGDRVGRALEDARSGRGSKRRNASRRTLRLVAAAGLVAALLAAGASTWALAMRGQVAVQKQAVTRRSEDIERLQTFIAQFQQRMQALNEANSANFRPLNAAERAKVFGALLTSPSSGGASGELLVVSIPDATPDFVTMQANIPPSLHGPFTVLFEQGSAPAIKAGGLVKTPNGDYVLSTDPMFFPNNDLSKLTGVVVLDHAGQTVLTGLIQLITTPQSR
jgi:cell division septum initiation protein DivIVA